MVDFETRTAQLDDLLGVGRNFDMVGRSLQVGGRQARLWVVNGYAEDMLIERMIGRLMAIGDLKKTPDLETFLAAYVTVPDAAAETDVHSMVVGVFAGKTLLVIDGYDGGAGHQQGAAGQPRRFCGEHHGQRRPAAPPHP